MSNINDLLKKRWINPLFGLPKQKRVDYPEEYPSEMWLVRLDNNNNNVESLRIQAVPLELEIDPSPNWAVIPSLGRNNPFYHYTGGEDTLQFQLDWYSVDAQRSDVISKCRWVQSLCKADGYNNEPPRILLIFGDVFKMTTWIIENAPYKLSLFDKSTHMRPRQAYQDLTLKKVTDHNTSIDDVRNNN